MVIRVYNSITLLILSVFCPYTEVTVIIIDSTAHVAVTYALNRTAVKIFTKNTFPLFMVFTSMAGLFVETTAIDGRFLISLHLLNLK
jgi:hypothetical protein